MRFPCSAIVAALAVGVAASASSARAAPVINELMFHPPHPGGAEDPRGEWLEIFNPDPVAVALDGWRLSDGVGFEFPAGTTLPPGGYVVVAADPPTFMALYPTVTNVLGGWSGSLSNGGEAVELSTGEGIGVDRVRYSDQGDWAARRLGPTDFGRRGWEWENLADGGGATLELRNPALPRTGGQNWAVTMGGTPGTTNAAAAGNIAPMVSEVVHDPAVPGPEDLVAVRARLLDESPADVAAVVHYRVSELVPGPFLAVPMNDEGRDGDRDPADGIFGAVLPAQPVGTVVEFYIETGDGAHARTWPGPTDPATRARGADLLYQVDPTPGAPGVPLYRLVMTVEDDAEFDALPRGSGRQTNAQLNATFIATVHGKSEVRYQTGVRLRGASSRADYPRSIRVNIPHDVPWEDSTDLNLNSQFSYLQVMGNRMFHAAGLAAYESRGVAVRMNGFDHASAAAASSRSPFAVHYGLYSHNEPLGSNFVRNHFPGEDGNLYKKVGTGHADWIYFPGSNDLAADYTRVGWEKQTNAPEADWTDLHTFLGVMNRANGPDAAAVADTVMDLGQWLRTLAVHAVLTNGENSLPTGVDDDYALYQAADGRMHLMAHDLDTILGLGDNSAITVNDLPYTVFDFIDPGTNNRGIDRFRAVFDDPAVVRAYYAELDALLNGPFAQAPFDAVVDETLGGVPQSVRASIKAFMDARRSDIASQIHGDLTAGTNLPLVDGFATTTSPSAPLSGSFDPTLTTRVSVNGVEAETDVRTGTWRLNPGTAALILSNAVWRYLDDGSDPGPDWTSPSFDDSSWASGPGPLGYGGDGETTVIAGGNNTHLADFFRHAFTVPDPAAFSSLTLRLRRDDGIVVYLNGSEVARDNLSGNPPTPDTPADSTLFATEAEWLTFPLDPSSLTPGENVIAAQVHQSNSSSPDLRFELELSAPLTERGLQPGLNRLVVAEHDATGAVLRSDSIDILYNDGDSRPLGAGPVPADRTLGAAEGPWVVLGDVTVPDGAVLTIAPGTSVFFVAGATLTVEPGGRLVCAGTPAKPIRLTRHPSAQGRWGGIEITGLPGNPSPPENVITHTVFEWGDGDGPSVRLAHARARLAHVTWENCAATVLELARPQLQLDGCTFPAVPASAVVRGSGLEGDDYLLVRRNVFAPSSGGGDIIAFEGGRRPGPVLTAYDNVFLGCADDCFDLDAADAHIEGNTFLHVHSDTAGDNSSNAVAATNSSAVTLARNVFYDIDHALLLKDNSEAVMENNTVVGATVAAVSFDEPQRPGSTPGRRLEMDSNIFVDCAALFASQISTPPEPDPTIVGHRNLIPSAHHAIGIGNIDASPIFAAQGQPPLPPANLALVPGSPGTGAGQNGIDMGALVPAGITPSGEPLPTTHLTSPTLLADGPGVAAYRWRLVTNGAQGPWSPETDPAQPVDLAGLGDATYKVDFIAQNSAGGWQAEAEATSSREWTVDPNYLGRVILNELQAAHPTAPDFIELHNTGPQTADLTGWSLSDDPSNPNRFTIPPGTFLPAGSYLTFAAPLTGFGLDRDGDEVRLYHGGILVDAITFGPQLPGFTIGRAAQGLAWSLTVPTPGAPNIAAPTAPGTGVRINEWLAAPEISFWDDFVELFNPAHVPAAIGGFFLSDAPGRPRSFKLPPLSFVPARGFLVFDADGRDNSGSLPFKFDAFYDWILFSDPDGRSLQTVHVACADDDVAEGFVPDGSGVLRTLALPSPGSANAHSEPTVLTSRSDLVTMDHLWRYEDTLEGTPAGWTEAGFDDSGWKSGPGPIGVDDDLPLGFFGTAIAPYRPAQPTYFFRTAFEFAGDPGATTLRLIRAIDDGYVLYLNGVPVDSLNLANIPPAFADRTISPVAEAVIDAGLAISPASLVNGTNTLAAEVHQFDGTSSDITFGVILGTEETTVIPAEPDPEVRRLLALADHLRITELHYHPANANGNESEFVELTNTSPTESLVLDGVRFSGGITFVFPTLTLPPGGAVLVVQDAAAFASLYGYSLPVAGVYAGRLDNAGEEIVLQLPAPYPNVIQRFRYDDAWLPATDGSGKSLEIINPLSPRAAWDDRRSWAASPAEGGSPGSANGIGAFATWLAAFDIAAPHNDPDGDGILPPLEYGLGLSPVTYDSGPLPVAVDAHPDGTSAIAFQIPYYTPSDAIYSVEAAGRAEAGGWTTLATRSGTGPWTGPASVSVSPPSGGRVNVSVSGLMASPHQYFRLRLTIGSPPP